MNSHNAAVYLNYSYEQLENYDYSCDRCIPLWEINAGILFHRENAFKHESNLRNRVKLYNAE